MGVAKVIISSLKNDKLISLIFFVQETKNILNFNQNRKIPVPKWCPKSAQSCENNFVILNNFSLNY